MNSSKLYQQAIFTGERALFHSQDLTIKDSVFETGESPLKESRNIQLENCLFRWKYPLWYTENIQVKDCVLFDMARAGVWYTKDVSVENTVVEAPKNFRRCQGLSLKKVQFPHAEETLWNCSDVTLEDVSVKGDYFAMNCSNMRISNLTLMGNYSFDGNKNLEIRNSRLLSKDAFWNCENVTVYDSFLTGEYLGWNTQNLTLINCTIESLQGLCYVKGLTLKNCKLFNTSYAFEYSTHIDADIKGRVLQVFNPSSGVIRAEEIGELILDPTKIDPSQTEIICNNIQKYATEGKPS